LKNAYAASAFKEVAASRAELDITPISTLSSTGLPTKCIPDDIYEILEEFRVTLHQDNVGGVRDCAGRGYDVGWPVKARKFRLSAIGST
jgi:hypothetical protein